MPTDLQALRDLEHVGLGAPTADEAFDRFARLVRRHLKVPAAVVYFVVPQGQVLAGASGMPEPMQSNRLLQYPGTLTNMIATRGEPVVSSDARLDPLLRDNYLVREMGLVAMAGYPVFDLRGRAVGALCAVVDEPREWSEDDLASLADLAAACTAELRLRAERERARRIQQTAVRANRRSRFLLSLSEAFANANTMDQVEEVIVEVGTAGIGARYCAFAVTDADGRGITYRSLVHAEPQFPQRLRQAKLDDQRPLAEAARTGRPLFFRTGEELFSAFPEVRDLCDPGVGARAFLPVVTAGAVVAVIVLAWERDRGPDKDSYALQTGLAHYTGHALERARLLEERRESAKTLQRAMLSRLPEVPHLDMAATYSPATRSDQIGGDWYDAVAVDDDATMFMIGDVTGHDMRAAAKMGQLRSLLRAFAWSHDESPSALLTLLDKANSGLGLLASGTAVVARLERVAGAYQLTWSTAGHPPPLVLREDGTVERLSVLPDMMLGVRPTAKRTDHVAALHPGDTLLLYTDGLAEQRGTTPDQWLNRLQKTLGVLGDTATAALPVTLVRRLASDDQRDDVAVLAVRVRAAAPSGPPSPGRPATAERKLAPSLCDVGPARIWVDDVLESCGVPMPLRRTVMLLTSEVLTNAVDHGQAPFTATVEVDMGRLRVGVRDSSTAQPELRDPTVTDFGGRGVQFLERLASRWGVDRHGESSTTQRRTGQRESRRTGKTVWFELDLR
ncbi:SpoIIE family protein phosphatase [Promicromonospora iranensis]|uniref:GAF domain-containing protein/anti-sigma regulatory factor (Ser/Thr protein kinase) n=1 Tax=Promicromonospora iranensis TaxID=1105144 RepID=A0ABU2CPS2_9MICO|nr:SpoIIE family protein phosphatase [Promicromonospora iranensis]MDR7383132.1 GAF domain-containing protein/anti-sigma regulatory factor (Ser/Thr protein kinase) [Promicromonospora iranensis]